MTTDDKDPTDNEDLEEILAGLEEDAREGEAQEQKTTEAESVVPLAQVLPLHAATAPRIPVKRGRGRPKKVEPKPTVDDLAYHAKMTAEKAAFVDKDGVVVAKRQRKESMEILQSIAEQIAMEAAALHFQRIENEKHGKDVAQISSRRIAALKEVANIELEVKKLGVQMFDLRGERFQKIFGLFIQKIRDTAQEVLEPQDFDLLFNRLETALEGWEDEAENLLR